MYLVDVKTGLERGKLLELLIAAIPRSIHLLAGDLVESATSARTGTTLRAACFYCVPLMPVRGSRV